MMKTLFYLVLHMIVINELSLTVQVSSSPRQVYPSEYACHHDYINRNERASANCRRYLTSALPGGDNELNYIHCDGTQLRLADSNLGSEQFGTVNYYWWPAGRDAQLLFIFPTRVSLTTITLHYYSDSDRGLPRLRFYAVADDFDVWDAPTIGIPYADITAVPPGGGPAGRRNVSINVNSTTKKVLMYNYRSTYLFAVSEVEFFNRSVTTTWTSVMTDIPTSSVKTASTFNTRILNQSTTTAKNSATSSHRSSTTPSSITDRDTSTVQSKDIIVIIVSVAILLLLSTTLTIVIVVLIWRHKRQTFYTDKSYSTLSRGTGQRIQPQSIQHDSAGLHDQIHLSPSTGQTEFIAKPESENINNPMHNHPTQYNTEHFVTPSMGSAPNINSQLASQNDYKITSEQSTYAAIDKSKKKPKKQRNTKDNNSATEKKGPPVPSYTEKVSDNIDKEACAAGKDDLIEISQKPLGDMYTSAHKDPKKGKQEVTPPHTIEELYTAVKKKPKYSVPKVEEETPPIPSHTVEELYTAVVKKKKNEAKDYIQDTKEQLSLIFQHTIDDLYTAVLKKPKDGSPDDTEAAPPIPPHTVEELYTAVQKEGTALEDEEEAP